MQSRDPVRVQEAHANLRRCAVTPGGGSLRTPSRGGGGASVPGTPAHGSRGATPASEFGGSSVCATHDDELDRADEVRSDVKPPSYVSPASKRPDEEPCGSACSPIKPRGPFDTEREPKTFENAQRSTPVDSKRWKDCSSYIQPIDCRFGTC